MKNKKKLLIIALILLFISPFFYKYYLYYQIPHNPFVEFSTEPITSSYQEYTPNYYDALKNPETIIFESNDNSTTCSTILKYFKNLNLKPVRSEDVNFDKFNYSYYFQLSSPSYDTLMIFISLEDLTNIYINFGEPGFRDGNYKIIDGEFDYKYINDLIINQK